MTHATHTAPTAAALTATLHAALAPTVLEVQDESYLHAGHVGANASGVGTHFRVRIDCPQFTGMGRVARHRLVYDALHDFLAQGLHAVAIEIPSIETRATQTLALPQGN